MSKMSKTHVKSLEVADVYENAIDKGMAEPDEWMYMYSKGDRDYFKNRNTRKYKSYENQMNDPDYQEIHNERLREIEREG